MTLSKLPRLFAALAFTVIPALAQTDSDFVKEASAGGLAEVELGKLAQQKGHSQSVKDFGTHMVMDHTKANDELKGVAASREMAVSTSIGVKETAIKLKLGALSGETFDKAYMSAMVKDHQEDIAAFQKEAANGKDSAIRDFAAKTLPTLKEHLAMAQRVANEVGAKID